MKKYSELFIAFDTARRSTRWRSPMSVVKVSRYLGEIDSSSTAIEKVLGKLAQRYTTLRVCYEAGPTGYGLYRQICALGHDCTVVAPSLIPRKPGERIKTNRRDAVTLARLFAPSANPLRGLALLWQFHGRAQLREAIYVVIIVRRKIP